MVAAKTMGVPPWELAEQPSFWMHWALSFDEAEHHAREMAERKPSKRRRA